MEQKNPNAHNTSDEQYDTAESSPTRDSTADPCRLSWFVVRNDPLYVEQFGQYYTIHAMDLIDPDYANAYIDNIVSYHIGDAAVTGKVLAVADDIKLLERSMHDWLEDDRKKLPLFKSNLFVQYRPVPNRLVHKILHESETVPMSSSQDPRVSSKDVFVRDGIKMCQAMVVTRNDNINVLISELTKVNVNVSERIRGTYEQPMDLDKDARTEPKDNPWILVQYSHSVRDCVYAIMSYDDTTKLENNAYPGLQTYLSIGNQIYQAIILHKSCNRNEVTEAMNNIAASCLVSIYPHWNDVEYRNSEIEKINRNLRRELFAELPFDMVD
ncbi:uncharacterized protein LOC105217198 isoform X2 [Zeugodacus cucurbitae]|uniref:uncharacterized protein LOC105217198 isoform X2 n=1 Tax=Zeugodacus cucurbitae TaxID=28588 RepID=UPI0023D8F34A|nr:uncharacterized protein LOC105217198 isoform X2 [Zeugodacus cucurbitae]